MQRIIEKLYYGEINIGEYFNPMKKEPFATAIAKGQSKESEFYERLPDDMKHDFEIVLQNRIDSASMEYVNMFSEGFRYGARVKMPPTQSSATATARCSLVVKKAAP